MNALVLGMIIDYFIGDPMSWPHPVIYIGKLIDSLEKRWINRKHKRLYGYLLVITVLLSIFVFIEGIYFLFGRYKIIGLIITVYGLFSAVAFRSLVKAGHDVYKALDNDDIKDARLKLSYIVGRDTKSLSETQIIKATVETIAENTIDGIIAPVFYAILGQIICQRPVLFIWLYKGINTMDSMVGYKNEKYMDFGFAGAKLDDIVNFIPARLGSIWMLICNVFNYDIKNGFKIFLRDRLNHKSPNSAHAESVVAGLLNIQLGGNSYYFGKLVEKDTIGDDIRSIDKNDILETEKILTRTNIGIVITLIFVIVIQYIY